MQTIHFLSANVPLTKTFTQHQDKSLTKTPYTHAYKFTSHSYDITTLLELSKLIKTHAEKGHCLLKGDIQRPLVDEPRKGSTTKTDHTSWVCLDFDRHEAADVDDELRKIGLGGVSYILQWSSSQGMPGTENTISCHVFMLLSNPISALTLRSWLMGLNFDHFSDHIKLTRDGNALRWPLDVTTCQNDKLLYIAPPTFVGLKDPLIGSRIEFIKHKLDKLPHTRVGERAPDALRELVITKRNELRRAAGMKAIRAGTVVIGEHEVQNKPGQATVTGVKECGDYTRINLNGGDSWSHWHFTDNFELLFTFKDQDTAYRLKEICPNYYTDLVAKRSSAQSLPNNAGDLVMAICDKLTMQYWKVLWNESEDHLELYNSDRVQLDDWMQSHGLTMPTFVPQWSVVYNPQANWTIDADNKNLNRFVRSIYMKQATKRAVKLEKECPIIMKTIRSMVSDDEDVVNAFLNWFACFFQRKGKPITSWTFHGNEGTGKGAFFSKIATPLLHEANVANASMRTLQDPYNGWLKNKLLIYCDEIDADAFSEKSMTTSLLRIYITEHSIPIREMRVVSHNAPNYFGIIFASNKDQPVYIPETDRRYNVGRFQANRLFLTPDEYNFGIARELQAFADYLYTLEANVERASQIVDTPDRRRIAKLAVTSVQETANTILRGDLQSLWNSMPDEKHLNDIATMSSHAAFASAYATLIRGVATAALDGNDRHNVLTRDELRTIFEYCVGGTSPSANKFSSMLRHHGIELERIRRNGDLQAGIRIDWNITPEFKDELRETLKVKQKPVAPVTSIKQAPARRKVS